MFTIPSVNIHYIKNRQYGVTTDIDGRYEISSDITGVDTLVFSFVGFRSERVLIKPGSKRRVNINLEPIDKTLDEVVITSKKSRYRRKNNPAVELMRKVIDAKISDLEEKLADYEDKWYRKFSSMEICHQTGKTYTSFRTAEKKGVTPAHLINLSNVISFPITVPFVIIFR